MPIQPNDMIPMALPAQAWDWIMGVLPQLNVPMQPRDQIVAMLQGQMKAQVERAEAADAMAGTPANDAPPPPPPAAAPRSKRQAKK